jgi:hypothetical protein
MVGWVAATLLPTHKAHAKLACTPLQQPPLLGGDEYSSFSHWIFFLLSLIKFL